MKIKSFLTLLLILPVLIQLNSAFAAREVKDDEEPPVPPTECTVGAEGCQCSGSDCSSTSTGHGKVSVCKSGTPPDVSCTRCFSNSDNTKCTCKSASGQKACDALEKSTGTGSSYGS